MHLKAHAILLLSFLLGSCLWAGESQSQFLKDFETRLPVVENQIPAIYESASTSAWRLMDNPGALLNVPWTEHKGFCEEMINRAGGLSHAYPTEPRFRRRQQTDHDIVLITVRDWETEKEIRLAQLEEYREKGWLVTMIASKAGAPDDLKVDYFLDNGAPDGTAQWGPVNILVNTMMGWMWMCEYTGAMTQRGETPGILISVAYLTGRDHNRPIQSADGRHTRFPATGKVEPHKLAQVYFDRIEVLIDDLRSEERMREIEVGAQIMAERIKSGKNVWLSGVGHLIEHEMHLNLECGWKALPSRGVLSRSLQNTQPGDLVVWVGYMGMNSRNNDYEGILREKELEFIVSYVPVDDNWEFLKEWGEDQRIMVNAEAPLAVIQQTWEVGDAEVEFPGPPGRMAPISGINAMLIARMLDEKTTLLLAEEK